MHVKVLCKTTKVIQISHFSPQKRMGKKQETKNIFYEQIFIINWSAKYLHLPKKTNTSPKGTRHPAPAISWESDSGLR